MIIPSLNDSWDYVYASELPTPNHLGEYIDFDLKKKSPEAQRAKCEKKLTEKINVPMYQCTNVPNENQPTHHESAD